MFFFILILQSQFRYQLKSTAQYDIANSKPIFRLLVKEYELFSKQFNKKET